MCLGAIWPTESFWDLKNKNAAQFATFLRLGIAAGRQSADFGAKTQQIGRKTAHFDRVPIAGVRAPCQKKVRPPPRIVVTTHRQDRRRPHGHFNRTGDRARGRPAQAGRQHRPERAGPRAPGGLPQRRDVGAGRRAAGRGQPPQRLPRAQSQHVRREDHPAHPEAEGGHLLPRRRAQALLEDGPGHGRGHSRDLPPGALPPKDREGRLEAGLRRAEQLGRVEDVLRAGCRRGRAAGRPLRHGLPLPMARRDLRQVQVGRQGPGPG